MNATKAIGYLILAIVGVFLAYVILKKVIFTVLALLIPIAIVGAIGLGLYFMVGRKALGGGRKRFLP